MWVRGTASGAAPPRRSRSGPGNETGYAAEGGDGPGRFVENEVGIAEEGANFNAGRFVRGGIRLE